MASPFRLWTKPEDALSKIAERIEHDLGSGDATALPTVKRIPGAATASALGVAGAHTGAEAYRANYLYVEKRNHWQNGATWPVSYPAPDIRERQLAKVRPMYASADVIGRAVRRQVAALLGREATIAITPLEPVVVPADDEASEDERETAQEARDAQDRERLAGLAVLSAWWDSVGLWSRTREACRRAAWSSRGPLRVRLLPSAFDGTDLVGGLAFADALKHLTLSAPEPDAALLYTDPNTQAVCCIISFREEDKPAAEVWFEEDGRTIRRILHADDRDPEELPLPGAALPLQEIVGDLLVTASVREGQAQLNYIKTKLTRVVQTATDRELFAANIEEPGEWSSVPPPPGVPVVQDVDSEGNTIYFHPGPWERGPEIVNIVQGRVTTGTPEKPVEVLTPQIVVVPPVDPEYVTKALDKAEASLLRLLSQAHTVNIAKATSGEEKKQDRADFAQHVGTYKQSTELAVAGVLTAAGRNALLLTDANDPMQGFFDRHAVSVTLHIDTGPLSAEEIKTDVELSEKGYKPRPDTMASAAGVEDYTAAEAAILGDPVQREARFATVLARATEIKNEWSAAAGVAYLKRYGGDLVDAEMLAAFGRGDFVDTTLEQ